MTLSLSLDLRALFPTDWTQQIISTEWEEWFQLWRLLLRRRRRRRCRGAAAAPAAAGSAPNARAGAASPRQGTHGVGCASSH
mmetsp:Transcript_122711/g.392951  ORF Transcript_122711/g.392951 Transcript_122711/m.392951 type:complete len:82 (+) Transcript_122711:173-418(+)